VQFGLDLQYPPLRATQRQWLARRHVGIHQRPPSIPTSALLTYWPPSPCARLSRARTTTGPPSHPWPSVDDGPAPDHTGRLARRAVMHGSRVHHHPVDEGGAQLYPDSIATPTPQTSTWPPHRRRITGFGVDPHLPAVSRAAIRPISTRLEPATRLRSITAGSSRTPSRLACRTRTVWQYRSAPALSGLLTALPCVSTVELPSASPACCDRPAAGPFIPPGN
jgi:hypothetical protein